MEAIVSRILYKHVILETYSGIEYFHENVLVPPKV